MEIVMLRDVIDDDLSIFFEQQMNKAANFMAAFTAKDPSDNDSSCWASVVASFE